MPRDRAHYGIHIPARVVAPFLGDIRGPKALEAVSQLRQVLRDAFRQAEHEIAAKIILEASGMRSLRSSARRAGGVRVSITVIPGGPG